MLIGGLLFGGGLALSGMTRPEVVLAFLKLEDLGLLLVMGGAVAVTALAFHLAPRVLRQPVSGTYQPPSKSWRKGTLLGAAVFGLGWGLAGVCPGAMLASLGTGNWPILYAIAGTFLGAYLQGRHAS